MPLPPQLAGRLRVPAVAAPMFLVSGPDLVVECCRAGVLGTFPALNERTSAGFEAWLTAIEERVARAEAAGERSAPYGVNLIVHKTNPRVDADLAYIGTRFIATTESLASDAYKAMLLDSGASDVIYTSSISGIGGNFLTQSLINAGVDLSKTRDQVDVADELMDSGAKAWKTIWTAGQGIAGIDELPTTRDLCQRLVQEFDAAADQLRRA